MQYGFMCMHACLIDLLRVASHLYRGGRGCLVLACSTHFAGAKVQIVLECRNILQVQIVMEYRNILHDNTKGEGGGA